MGWLLLPCHGVNDKNDKYETSVFLWINQMSPLPLCIEWDFIQNRWFHKFHIRSGLFLYFLASAEDLCVECSTKDPMATFSEYNQFYSIPVTRVNKDYLRSVIQQSQAILLHATQYRAIPYNTMQFGEAYRGPMDTIFVQNSWFHKFYIRSIFWQDSEVQNYRNSKVAVKITN